VTSTGKLSKMRRGENGSRESNRQGGGGGVRKGVSNVGLQLESEIRAQESSLNKKKKWGKKIGGGSREGTMGI